MGYAYHVCISCVHTRISTRTLWSSSPLDISLEANNPLPFPTVEVFHSVGGLVAQRAAITVALGGVAATAVDVVLALALQSVRNNNCANQEKMKVGRFDTIGICNMN